MVPGRPQVLLKNSQKAFTYDFAFPSSSEQGQIYEKSVQPLIEKLFKGDYILKSIVENVMRKT